MPETNNEEFRYLVAKQAAMSEAMMRGFEQIGETIQQITAEIIAISEGKLKP